MLSVLKIGNLYAPEYLHKIQSELQSHFGPAISKNKTPNEVILLCRHHTLTRCPFNLSFTKLHGDDDSIALQLVHTHLVHNCTELPYIEEEIQLARAKTQIDSLKPYLFDLISTRFHSHGIQNPRRIMQLLVQQNQWPQDFIFRNIKDKTIMRKLKKKFDNLVAEVKRQIIAGKKDFDDIRNVQLV